MQNKNTITTAYYGRKDDKNEVYDVHSIQSEEKNVYM